MLKALKPNLEVGLINSIPSKKVSANELTIKDIGSPAKVFTDKKLQTDLDWGGTVGICISCGLGIYLSGKEVIKLF
jgi:hypothetical protein